MSVSCIRTIALRRHPACGNKDTLLFHPFCTRSKSTCDLNSSFRAEGSLPVSHATSEVSWISGRAMIFRSGLVSKTGSKLSSAVYNVRRSGEAVTRSMLAWRGKFSRSLRHCSWPRSVSKGSGITWFSVQRLCRPCVVSLTGSWRCVAGDQLPDEVPGVALIIVAICENVPGRGERNE
jgi:hypothetical protein